MPVPHRRRQLLPGSASIQTPQEAAQGITTTITAGTSTSTPTTTVTNIPVVLVNMAPAEYPNLVVVENVLSPPSAAAAAATQGGNPFDMPGQTTGQTITVWLVAAGLVGLLFMLILVELWLKSRRRVYAVCGPHWRRFDAFCAPYRRRWDAKMRRLEKKLKFWKRKGQDQPEAVLAPVVLLESSPLPLSTSGSGFGSGSGAVVEVKGKGKEVSLVVPERPEPTAAVARLASPAVYETALGGGGPSSRV
ncbi:hypothetical protein B0T19DRAFT_488957 [Cercophora scortea]|uniref:Uncharacterized protein n=1 Tax=Cercophora scortea TaxID=314031 RepID=A0AAE0I3A0_9PEZI|nr:hypothetical protein B0T19DRAFT_488957 [Cercophora scortea]